MSQNPPLTVPERLAENVEAVRSRVSAAARRAGRDPSEVTLVAITKHRSPALIRPLYDLGIADVGENRVQEAEGKLPAIPEPFRWHLVGHLQRNKARRAADRFAVIHSIDSPRLIRHLDRIAAERGGEPVRGLLQVNVSGEEQKYGAAPDAVRSLLAAAGDAAHVEIRGLMGMAPFVPDPEEARPAFRELARIRRDANRGGWYRVALAELSMGMTNDFEVAVEEGATMVRVGTALFEGVEQPPPAAERSEDS